MAAKKKLQEDLAAQTALTERLQQQLTILRADKAMQQVRCCPRLNRHRQSGQACIKTPFCTQVVLAVIDSPFSCLLHEALQPDCLPDTPGTLFAYLTGSISPCFTSSRSY